MLSMDERRQQTTWYYDFGLNYDSRRFCFYWYNLQTLLPNRREPILKITAYMLSMKFMVLTNCTASLTTSTFSFTGNVVDNFYFLNS